MVLEGSFNGKRVRVLKDDGCNTNVVSGAFLKKNSALFDVAKRPVEAAKSPCRRRASYLNPLHI